MKLYYGFRSPDERRGSDCVEMMNKQLKKTAAYFQAAVFLAAKCSLEWKEVTTD